MSVKASADKQKLLELKRLKREKVRLQQKLALKQQALEKARGETEFLKNIFSSIPFPFILIDAEDYTVLLANSTDGKQDQSKKTTCYGLTHGRKEPCSGEESLCPLEEIKRTGKPVFVEHVHHDAQGVPRHVDVRAFPVFDDFGRIARIMEFCFDVTECRQAEKSLFKSEEFNRGFIENSRDCIKVLDLDQRIIFMNQGGLDLMGLIDLDPIREVPYEEFWRHDRQAARRAVQDGLEGGKGSFQGYLETFKGEPKWWDVTVAPLFDAQGRVENLLVVSHDITSHKKAEDELVKYRDSLEDQIRARTAELEAANHALETEIQERKSAEKKLSTSELWLRSTFNTLDLAIIVATPERKLVGINDGARQMFGYSWEEINEFTTEVLHVDLAHYLDFGQRIKKAFAEGRTARFEFVAKRKNGQIFPSEHFVSLLRDDQGVPIGILSVVRDISELKQAEDNLHRSQVSLARAQEIAHLGNWDWDLASKKLFWSDEICRLLGRESGEFGDKFDDFLAAVHPEDREMLQSAVDMAIYEGRKYNLEHRIVRPDNSVRLVREVGEVTYDEEGRAVHFLGTVQDITEQKEAEEELNRYRQHLEEMIRMRTAELENSNRQLLKEINERKQAEEALQESERHLRTLMEQAPVGILTLDNSGLITEANPKSIELLDSPDRKATLGLNVLTLPTLVQAGLDHYFRLVLDQGLPQDIEALYTSIWGKQSYLRSRIVPRYDAQGVQNGAIQILEDITAAREAEADRRKLYQAVEHSSSTVIITGPAGQIEYVNPKFSETTGYTREEAMGQNPRILKSGVHGPEVYQDLWNTLKRGGEWRGELLNRRKNGELYWEIASISAIRDSKGEITHYVAVKEDITDHKMAEKQLRRELAVNSATTRLAETLISTDAPIADITSLVMEEALKLTASRNGFVSEVDSNNRITVKHVYAGIPSQGCPLAEPAPKSTAPRDRSGFPGLWGYALDHRQGFYTNEPRAHPAWTNDAPPGHIPIQRFLSVPATVSGELVGQINLANSENDYTRGDLEAVQRLADLYALAVQRSRTSEDLREAKIAAEAANRAKSEFLANMSHEIRTPMNAIMGMIDLTLNTGLNHEQKDNLITARTSSRHLLGIINNILDLSKIESGRVELEITDFNLVSLLESARRMFIGQAKEKRLTLDLNMAPGVPTFLRGDPNRLRQVLVNLIGNAFKFTERGRIDLRIELAEPAAAGQTLAPTGKTVLLFSVRDTGVGLEEENRERIFESFRQADSYTARKYGGTGLGLAISRHLVEMMDGRIWVESKKGLGSSFFFTAVFDPGDPEQVPVDDPEQEKEPGHQEKMMILLAEDNPVNAKVAEKLLDLHGHTTVRAANGMEALGHLNRHGFDLVLMDVEMPEMDGFEAARRIRAGEAGENNRDIPIIAMTAHALREFREKARQAGMNDFITKPVDFYEFNSILRRNFKGKSVRHLDIEMTEKQTVARKKLLDRQAALGRIGGDEELLDELLSIMATDLRLKIEQLKQALAKKDLPLLNKLAHSLRTSCGTVGANSCGKLAYEVEQATRKGADESLDPLIRNLLLQLAELQKELERPPKNNNI